MTVDGPAPPPGEGGSFLVAGAPPDDAASVVRVRIDLGYDGTDFSGWARQPTRRTVQGDLEAALCTVLRVPEVRLTVAGRTDAGVHAAGQVAHADLQAPVDPAALARRLNGVLAPDVRIRQVQPAPPGFDARFSALSRRYVYRIADGYADPLRRRDTLAWPRPLDGAAMHDAAQLMLGEHDFAAYCKRREGATTVRRLLGLDVVRRADGGDVLEVTVEADAFCHSMVRALVGSLLAVGEGRRDRGWPAEVLAAARRPPDGRVVAAHGLTLMEVRYPPDDALAARVEQTRRLRVLADPA